MKHVLNYPGADECIMRLTFHCSTHILLREKGESRHEGIVLSLVYVLSPLKQRFQFFRFCSCCFIELNFIYLQKVCNFYCLHSPYDIWCDVICFFIFTIPHHTLSQQQIKKNYNIKYSIHLCLLHYFLRKCIKNICTQLALIYSIKKIITQKKIHNLKLCTFKQHQESNSYSCTVKFNTFITGTGAKLLLYIKQHHTLLLTVIQRHSKRQIIFSDMRPCQAKLIKQIQVVACL